MSFYNMVYGKHPIAPQLLKLLGYTKETLVLIPRFRDIFLFPDEIRLLTRTGGDNRNYYQLENELLIKHADFIKTWNDDYDSTFAWWSYSWPTEEDYITHKELNEMVDMIKKNAPYLLPESLKERTEALTASMKR